MLLDECNAVEKLDRKSIKLKEMLVYELTS